MVFLYQFPFQQIAALWTLNAMHLVLLFWAGVSNHKVQFFNECSYFLMHVMVSYLIYDDLTKEKKDNIGWLLIVLCSTVIVVDLTAMMYISIKKAILIIKALKSKKGGQSRLYLADAKNPKTAHLNLSEIAEKSYSEQNTSALSMKKTSCTTPSVKQESNLPNTNYESNRIPRTEYEFSPIPGNEPESLHLQINNNFQNEFESPAKRRTLMRDETKQKLRDILKNSQFPRRLESPQPAKKHYGYMHL